MSDYDLVSQDAQAALQEFAQDFAMALTQGGVEQWAMAMGVHKVTRALKTTWPVPVSAAGYAEFEGDIKYRSIFEKSFELKPETWQDGVSELASVIEAPDFIGWSSEPAAIAAAAMSLQNEIVAELITANAVCWDGQNFFDTDHPYNVFDAAAGTYSNKFTGAGTDSTVANLALAKARFRDIKGPNGKPLGLRMTHVLVPAALEETWRDILERDLIIEAGATSDVAMNNRHKGSVKLVVSDELESDAKWYCLALNKPGMRPWVLIDQGAPEELRSDKESHLYKTTLKVGVAYILRANAGLALPHCIQEWAGTAP
jgi:phage major head subunit gpT-like protein